MEVAGTLLKFLNFERCETFARIFHTDTGEATVLDLSKAKITAEGWHDDRPTCLAYFALFMLLGYMTAADWEMIATADVIGRRGGKIITLLGRSHGG